MDPFNHMDPKSAGTIIGLSIVVPVVGAIIARFLIRLVIAWKR